LLLLPAELTGKDSKAFDVFITISQDAAVQAAALEYLRDSHFLPFPADYPLTVPSSFISPWTGTHKTKMIDNVMRRVVLRTLAENPISALKLYFLVKPLLVARNVAEVLRDSPTPLWLFLLLLGGLATTAVGWVGMSYNRDLQLSYALLLIGLAIPFAALPDLWAWPMSYSISDPMLVMFVFAQLAIGVLGLYFIRRYQFDPKYLKR
jgi:hypothetical protein